MDRNSGGGINFDAGPVAWSIAPSSSLAISFERLRAASLALIRRTNVWSA